MPLHAKLHLVAVGAFVVALPALSLAALSVVGTPSASFSASGPGGLKIVGTTAELTVADSPEALTITVPLGKLTTGIGLRDSHMREKYLQVQTYPNATLVAPRASLTFPAQGARFEGDAPGTLTIHGQTRPTTFHYSVRHDGAAFGVDATVHVNLRDYGIEIPVYLGVGVKPDVDVTVRFDAQDSA